MQSFLNWLDHRTGYRRLLHEALYENIPGGARWRYVWGSTLVFAFAMQVITGIVLWMAYSPSAQTAWESVFYIQTEMTGGWLVRGLHHYTSQVMVVLLVLHLMQVVIDRAYKAPREVNFWLGLVLMLVVLGLSLTGYLLPWDQKGYWATRVATNLAGLVPLVGTSLQELIVGGPEYGHHTLTRFFALHAGLLPATLVVFLVMHLAVFRRHKITHKLPLKAPDQFFWPDQILRDAVACLAVLAVVLFLVFRHGITGDHAGLAAGDYLGADLGPPADPSREYSAARPEWYFLFLFQFLKLFEGMGEFGELLGAIIVPALILLGLFLMPIVGRWRLGHRFNLGYVACLLVGVVMLTVLAVRDDYRASWIDDAEFAGDPQKIAAHFEGDEEKIEAYNNSKDFLNAVAGAERDAERIRELARSPVRIPVEGAAWLLRNDPHMLFEQNCATCHMHVDAEGQGMKPGLPSAANLYRFGSREWVGGLLDPKRINKAEYFGNTRHKGQDMVGFIQGDDWTSLPAESREDVAIALSADAKLPYQAEADARDADRIKRGRQLIKDWCTECHSYADTEIDIGPDLRNYGSQLWLVDFIANPMVDRFYPELPEEEKATTQFMPPFCETPLHPELSPLTPRQIQFIAAWLRGEWAPSEAEE